MRTVITPSTTRRIVEDVFEYMAYPNGGRGKPAKTFHAPGDDPDGTYPAGSRGFPVPGGFQTPLRRGTNAVIPPEGPET